MSNLHLIPEVFSQVTEYFTKKQATVPACVCRAWNDVFASRIWHTVAIDLWHTAKGLTPEGFTRNAHHIRSLIIDDIDASASFLVPCTRLTVLQFHANIVDDVIENWGRFAKLIRNNPNLQQLIIWDINGTSTQEVWKALPACSSFKSVHITNAKLDHDNALVFWEGCLGIQELFISVLYLQDSATFFDVAPNTLPNLLKLELYMVNQTSSADYLVILKKTPNLRTLLFPARSNILAPAIELINILQDGYLPSLEALELSHLVEDADMALCLQAMNQVRALSSNYGLFSNLAFSNLVRHFSTLQSLDLFRCPGFTGDMIQTVLESCPLLETIKAGTLPASTIMAGKPWTCLRLTLFQVSVLVDPGPETVRAQSWAVFARLAQLTELAKLDITSYSTLVQSLDFRVDSGVEQLEVLRRLKKVKFMGTLQSVSIAEVELMRESWKRR